MANIRIKVACIQNHATLDENANVAWLFERVREAAAQGVEFACLPEYGTCFGRSGGGFELGARDEAAHPVLARMRELAAQTGLWLMTGSLAISTSDGRISNRAFMISPDGEITARYDKIHLFDVDLAGKESYRESDTVSSGDRAVVADIGKARVGMTICYDIRFPELYRTLAKAGADILTIPAAFTRKTGSAHWHVLVRSRAIETGSYVLATGQCGEDEEGKLQRYGHSLIVTPWGEVLADAGPEPGMIMAELDLAKVEDARRMVPALRHDRDYRLDDPRALAAE
ncbi:MAG: carbon-nitrogen hydrolase family protein [Geminicoccaceae bacterium]|nr:carbon-nitrogen hydrolase family protein [Geminicoccaceae bacterium]